MATTLSDADVPSFTSRGNNDDDNNNTTSSTNNVPSTAEAYQYLYQTEERSRDCLIQLNNRALRYLQSGRERLALQTFQSAFAVLQQKRDPVTLLSSDDTTDSSGPGEEDHGREHKHNPLVPTVVSSCYSPAQALATFDPQENVCIRIEDGVDHPVADWPLVKCTLVYNFGVCHCHVVYNHSTHPHLSQLGALCLTIYQYAESLLPAGDADEYLLLSLVLLRKLQAWTTVLQMPIAADYQRNVDTLVATIQQQQQQQQQQYSSQQQDSPQQQQDSSSPP